MALNDACIAQQATGNDAGTGTTTGNITSGVKHIVYLIAIFSFVFPLCTLGCVIWPILTPSYVKYNSDEIWHELWSEELTQINVCAIAISSVLLIDVISDYLIFTKEVLVHMSTSIRAASVVSLLVASVIYSISANRRGTRLLKLFSDYIGCGQIFVEFSLLYLLLYKLNTKGAFNLRYTITIICMLFTLTIFVPYTTDNIGFELFTVCFSALTLGTIVFSSLRHLYIIQPKATSSVPDLYSAIILTTLIVVSVVILLVISTSLRMNLPRYYFHDCIYCTRITCTVVLCLLPGRMYRLEAVKREIQEHVDRLHDLLEVKRETVLHVSHEIKGPLATAEAGIELLMAKLTDTKAIEDLVVVKEACSAALDILADLLTFERLEAGLMTLDTAVVLASPFLDRAMIPSRVNAARKNILFTIHKESLCFEDIEDVFLEIDRGKINQLVRNLCSNAIKFTPNGGKVDVKYMLHEVLSIKYLRISVTDSGCGISPENIERLFRPGVQFQPNRNQAGAGSGMGLWISKRIVDLHGGILTGASAGLGKGSTFSFEFPIHVAADNHSLAAMYQSLFDTKKIAPEVISMDLEGGRNTTDFVRKRSHSFIMVSPQQESGFAAGIQYPMHPMRVLIVEDLEPTRKVIARLLMGMGHTCSEAIHGFDALEKFQYARARKDNFDLILMDNEMPECNGPQAAKMIRAARYRGIIIGMTGLELTDELKEHYMHYGADRVLSKPISSFDIFKAVSEVHAER